MSAPHNMPIKLTFCGRLEVTTMIMLPVALLFSLAGTPVPAANDDLLGVLKTIEAFRIALEGGDARAFADLFSTEADFTNIVDQSVHGRANIYEHHVNVFRNRPPTRTIHVLSHTVRFLKSDVAVVEIRWDNKHAMSPDGATLPDRDGVWVSTMTKENGQWYFTVVRNVMLNDGSKAKALK